MLASLKLVDMIAKSADSIARQWARDVIKNPKTPAYNGQSEEIIMPKAVEFYNNFCRIATAKEEETAAVAQKFFHKYAEDRYREGLPLNEAIYAMILMRRHIWLYAEFQQLFVSAIELKSAVDALNRTLLLFDYAMYFISQRYQTLISGEMEKKIGAIMIIHKDNPLARIISMIVLLAAVMSLTYYCHAVKNLSSVFTHLFYIPVILAGVWWRKKGILIALFLGLFLIASHFFFLETTPIIEDIIRAVMFLAVGAVVAIFSEGLSKAKAVLNNKRL